MIKVLFVCLGNICRSPTAHGVFDGVLKREKLTSKVLVDSAGTAAWHIGKSPDERSQLAAKNRGYDLSYLSARQVEPSDFEGFDYILAMDKSNYANLIEQSSPAFHHKIKLFLDYAQTFTESEVPDPYYGGAKGFDRVLDLVEDACEGLLRDIRLNHDV
ncbi:low molecular weight protein-tyrosine-phosphatase [Alkalimarinus sediminis]|uniref:Low molecular weight phosphotyrosine protein phosphatase n=1 Tax=Alkalimarinus sediminis TaxID=1632866 RepID=A0A9E8HUU1_9ALTE|nr:low molecular weight protein-tyrosine-phosphatase [Alkalimarinus sediminis]UZW76139.1 low molecular weight phosphotyrosine protein phosphatase [Alkalimarinus sediminis]